MASTININPVLTTNGLGSFSVQSDGFVQGVALDDPVIRNLLAGGVLATTETLPMWGGIPIQEDIPLIGFGPLGPSLQRATTVTNITGFSVLNQATAWITSPQSQSPSAAAGMTIPFYRIGSNARIAVAMDPSLVDLDGGLITQQVSWDFNNSRLQAYETGATVSVTSMTWAATNGGQIAVVTAAASDVGAVGDAVNISGATNTGTGGNAAVNGNFIVNTFTDNEHFTIAAPAATGYYGTIAGTILLNVGTGALNVRVLETKGSNCKTVTYNPVTGFVNWNNNGACAIILI